MITLTDPDDIMAAYHTARELCNESDVANTYNRGVRDTLAWIIGTNPDFLAMLKNNLHRIVTNKQQTQYFKDTGFYKPE